jgi:hypothetical protein
VVLNHGLIILLYTVHDNVIKLIKNCIINNMWTPPWAAMNVLLTLLYRYTETLQNTAMKQASTADTMKITSSMFN